MNLTLYIASPTHSTMLLWTFKHWIWYLFICPIKILLIWWLLVKLNIPWKWFYGLPFSNSLEIRNTDWYLVLIAVKILKLIPVSLFKKYWIRKNAKGRTTPSELMISSDWLVCRATLTLKHAVILKHTRQTRVQVWESWAPSASRVFEWGTQEASQRQARRRTLSALMPFNFSFICITYELVEDCCPNYSSSPTSILNKYKVYLCKKNQQ